MHSAAISRDGSRVIWRVGGSEAGHLYMRELDQEATLQVDEPDTGAPAPKVESIPDFKSASADGSRVFFTDTQRLTANSTAPEEDSSATPRDLYVFEPDKPAGERVTDLTPDVNSGEGAGVHGTVMASEDGSLVYFVANGVLAEGAEAGDCTSVRRAAQAATSTSPTTTAGSGKPPAGSPGSRAKTTPTGGHRKHRKSRNPAPTT